MVVCLLPCDVSVCKIRAALTASAGGREPMGKRFCLLHLQTRGRNAVRRATSREKESLPKRTRTTFVSRTLASRHVGTFPLRDTELEHLHQVPFPAWCLGHVSCVLELSRRLSGSPGHTEGPLWGSRPRPAGSQMTSADHASSQRSSYPGLRVFPDEDPDLGPDIFLGPAWLPVSPHPQAQDIIVCVTNLWEGLLFTSYLEFVQGERIKWLR